jgi:hypothetical protein
LDHAQLLLTAMILQQCVIKRTAHANPDIPHFMLSMIAGKVRKICQQLSSFSILLMSRVTTKTT